MKNKWKRFVAWLEGNPVTKVIVMFFRALWRLLAHNFGLKVLALLIAVLMWNFVLTSDTSITRSKTISGLTCYISNQSALKTYGLALLDNPTEELSNISVVVEVPQADYAYATADNVQVTLDLSGIRTAGTREVRLKASTSYGKVVRILPDTIPLTFEALDSRQIPINVQISGEIRDDMWYNINRSNPSSVTISGAASVVQNIAKAYVYVDVTGAEQSFEVPERYVLLDRDGNEISQSMLDRSSTSVSASVDVYPTKEMSHLHRRGQCGHGPAGGGLCGGRHHHSARDADGGRRPRAAGGRGGAARGPHLRGGRDAELHGQGLGGLAVVVQVHLRRGGLRQRRD